MASCWCRAKSIESEIESFKYTFLFDGLDEGKDLINPDKPCRCLVFYGHRFRQKALLLAFFSS